MGLTTIIYAVIIFCILILIHELGHFVAAKSVGVRVNEFSLGMGPLLFQFARGETQYSLRAFPVGGFCRMEGEDQESKDDKAFNNKPIWARAVVVIAGSFMNLIMAILILAGIAMAVGVATNGIAQVEPGSPAALAGIVPGDKIVRIEGEKVSNFRDVARMVSTSQKEAISLEIQRNKETLAIKTGVIKDDTGRTIIGIKPEITKSPGAALQTGAANTFSMARQMLAYLGQLFTGRGSMEDLVGPVGIVTMIGDQARIGFLNLLNLTALISLNLAIVNMLPLPALDGGRLLFLVIRLFTGKAVSDKVEGQIHMTGMILLLVLMVYILIQDMFRFVI